MELFFVCVNKLSRSLKLIFVSFLLGEHDTLEPEHRAVAPRYHLSLVVCSGHMSPRCGCNDL